MKMKTLQSCTYFTVLFIPIKHNSAQSFLYILTFEDYSKKSIQFVLYMRNYEFLICSQMLLILVYMMSNIQMDSDEESFSSNLTNSLHQELNHEQQIESNLVSRHETSQRRAIDQLYENIIQKNLQPKEWLKRAKTAKKILSPSGHQKNVAVIEKITKVGTQKNHKSYQEEIVLSNYKQLLRNHFQSQQDKDQDLHQLQKTCHQRNIQNARILQENRQLKKQMVKILKQKHEKDEKIKNLSSDLRKLSRKYDNLLNETAAKQASLNTQMRRLKEQKSSYENLVNALKESIHILKGKRVKDLEQIWQEWKHIFQLASLQQCKLSKKSNKN